MTLTDVNHKAMLFELKVSLWLTGPLTPVFPTTKKPQQFSKSISPRTVRNMLS